MVVIPSVIRSIPAKHGEVDYTVLFTPGRNPFCDQVNSSDAEELIENDDFDVVIPSVIRSIPASWLLRYSSKGQSSRNPFCDQVNSSEKLRDNYPSIAYAVVIPSVIRSIPARKDLKTFKTPHIGWVVIPSVIRSIPAKKAASMSSLGMPMVVIPSVIRSIPARNCASLN